MIEFQATENQHCINAALSLPYDVLPNLDNQKEVTANRTSALMLGIVLSIVGILFGLFLLYIGLLDIIGTPGTGAGFPFWLALLGSVFVLVGSIKYFYDSIRSKMARLDQSTVKKTTNDYYSSVLDVTGAHSWGRPYSLLAQSNFALPGKISLNNFSAKWIEMKENIADYFFQRILQDVQCETCGKNESGIWGQKPTSFIMKHTQFVKCSNNDCNEVYCFKCYSKLGLVKKCKCGQVGKWLKYHQLEKCGYDSVNFEANPKINIKNINERISNVMVDFKGTTTIKVNDISEQSMHEFQCRFHNCALNFGDKWYLTQSEPGKIASWSENT